MLMKILASLRPARQEITFDPDQMKEAAEACPALAALSIINQENTTPFMSSIKTTLVQAYQAFEQNGHAHALAGLTPDVLEQAEENLKAGKVDKLLAEVPHMKSLMKEKNSWAAGTAIALASIHYVIQAATEETPAETEVEAPAEKEDNAPPLPSAPSPASKGLGDLLAFFATLGNIGVPMEAITLHPVSTLSATGAKGCLIIRGTLSAPVPFTLLAKINAAMKKSWPSAPDLEFSGGNDESIIFHYAISQ